MLHDHIDDNLKVQRKYPKPLIIRLMTPDFQDQGEYFYLDQEEYFHLDQDEHVDLEHQYLVVLPQSFAQLLLQGRCLRQLADGSKQLWSVRYIGKSDKSPKVPWSLVAYLCLDLVP